MTTGLTRRDGAQDSLAGRDDVQPLVLQGPGLQAPAPIRTADTSIQSRIADQLLQWGGGKLSEAVQTQQKKDMLDGQMAHLQGETLDQVQMGGNKWALEGYRLVDAQTIASSMLAAQREQIAQVGHTLTPEQYRAQFTNRVDAMLQGTDPRTADLVREQMIQQMPVLVEDHTTQHLRYLEGKNFESIERGIDVISRDPTAHEALIDFARGGEGSASSGMTTERRQAATVAGVVRAFDGDNPLAYSFLAKEGLLGDNLTSDEQNQIRAAQARFENRRRSEYNAELLTGEKEIQRKIEQGEYTSPTQAVEELSLLYADHDINMTQAEAGSVYDSSYATSRTANFTRGTLIEEAGLRGDRDTQANLIMDSLIVTESGGRAGAFRTNDDGRSFGGLVQMGDARLTDYANATGTAPMTAAQYAALSGPEQKNIARWHFKDLIAQAEATGAVGTVINGVTVTLSGLVAVGHLGGGPGMRRFVETGGEYNPADQLGTSLTDYLARHATGERDEMLTANERAQVANQRLTRTRERLAMNTYEEITPRLAEVDDQFRAGDLDEGQWRSRREMLFARWEQDRTKADVDHEIAMTREVDRRMAEVAKASDDDAYKVAVETAETEIIPFRVAWERALADENATPETIRAANEQYAQDQAAIYGQHGVKFLDRDVAGTTDTMINTANEALDRWNTRQGEQVEIDAAVGMGYLDKLPKELQQRAFKQFEEQTQRTYQDAIAKREITPEDATAMAAADFNAFYAQAGVVDPRVAMRMTAAVMGPMIDKDGNPNPNVVDAITQYAEVKALNPDAAKTMLDPEALIRAEAALSRAPDVSLLGEAVRNIGLEQSGNPLVQDTNEYMARTDVQQSISREVENYLDTRDIGILHAVWQNDATLDQMFDNSASAVERIRSDETRGMIQGELEAEVSRLQRITPGMRPRDLVAHAAENVSGRTEIIGGDVVMLPRGQGSFAQRFFGARASEFMHDGAINSAVIEFLRTPEMKEQYPFIDEVTASEFLAPSIQSGINSVAGVFGGSFEPAMSNRDFRSTITTGVRPFRAMPTPGGAVAVQVLMPDGNYSDAIVLDPAEVGKVYMDKRRGEFAR